MSIIWTCRLSLVVAIVYLVVALIIDLVVAIVLCAPHRWRNGLEGSRRAILKECGRGAVVQFMGRDLRVLGGMGAVGLYVMLPDEAAEVSGK